MGPVVPTAWRRGSPALPFPGPQGSLFPHQAGGSASEGAARDCTGPSSPQRGGCLALLEALLAASGAGTKATGGGKVELSGSSSDPSL